MRDDSTPEDLKALFEAERAAPVGADPRARARVLARVLDRTGGGGSSGGGEPAPAPAAPIAGSLPTFAAVSAVSLAIGIGLGAWGHASWGDAADPREERDAALPVAEEVSQVEVLVEEEADAGSLAVAPRPRRAQRAPVPIAPAPIAPELLPGATHAEERGLIDRGRVAVRRGAYHDALVTLMEHERRFSSGELREERDRLIIEALIGERRNDPARRRIERYLRDHPGGLHRQDVERMAAELP